MSFYGPKEIVAISEEGGAYIALSRNIHDEYHCGLIRRAVIEYLPPEKLAQLSPPEFGFAVGSLLQ